MVNGRTPTLFLPLLVVSSLVTQLSAQQVATVEVFPDTMTLELDERVEMFAETSDSLGDFVEIAAAEWRSSADSIVRIELDMEIPGVATAIAVGSGTATVSVRIQKITTMIPVTVVGHVTLERPVRLSCPPLQYPDRLRQRGIEGTVVIQAVVDTTGHIDRNSIQIISSDHEGFNTAASELLMRCLYTPGRRRGLPVSVVIRQSISFGLTR